MIYEQARQGQRPEGGADRAGAAEHLHQLGRQYRPRRNRAGADRISGAGASDPATSSRCACRWWSGRATTRRRSCRASTCARDGGGWGATTSDPVPGPRPHLAAGARSRAAIAPVNPTSITVHLQAGFPLGEVKSHHHTVKIESPDDDHARHHAGRRRGAGRPRFRADLEAGGREGAVGRPVPRACRRRRLSARLRHAARASSRPSRSRCRARSCS